MNCGVISGQFYLREAYFAETLIQLKEGNRLSEPAFLGDLIPHGHFILVNAREHPRRRYWSVPNNERRAIIRTIGKYLAQKDVWARRVTVTVPKFT